MAEYKYFFNDKPVSEQEWYEMVKADTDTVEITESNIEKSSYHYFKGCDCID